MFRTTISSSMDVYATTSVTDQLPAKRWALQAADILVGHSALDGFGEQAEQHGKQVALKQFAPLGTTEFGSQISKIEHSGADGLYVFASGADGVAFVNQAKQFKLFNKVKTVVGFSTFSDETFAAMGDEITGFYNNLTYAWDFDNPQNKQFVAAYEKAYGEKPFFIPAENYLAAQFLFAAVKKAGSVDVEKVKAAMNNLTIDTINGKLTMRPQDHQALRDTYVGKIVKKNGALGWEVVSTVPPEKSTPQPSPDCKM
jgi:branched-chain amino acid transport system substrate-binding protein